MTPKIYGDEINTVHVFHDYISSFYVLIPLVITRGDVLDDEMMCDE